MANRKRWARWAVALGGGHVAGSYGFALLFPLLAKLPSRAGSPVRWSQWLTAPAWVLPSLTIVTARAGRRGLPSFAMVSFWAPYLVPFVTVMAITVLVDLLRRRRAAAPRGFAPILTDRPDGARWARTDGHRGIMDRPYIICCQRGTRGGAAGL